MYNLLCFFFPFLKQKPKKSFHCSVLYSRAKVFFFSFKSAQIRMLQFFPIGTWLTNTGKNTREHYICRPSVLKDDMSVSPTYTPQQQIFPNLQQHGVITFSPPSACRILDI